MPTASFYPRYLEQEGWTDHDATAFQVNYFGGMGIEVGREFLYRISDVDIPAGATITSAYIVHDVYVKNPDRAGQYVTYDYFVETTAAGNNVVRQDALPLRSGQTEETLRNWSIMMNAQFLRPTSTGNDKPWTINITSFIVNALTTNGGRHIDMVFRWKCLAEDGDLGVHDYATNRPVRLEVTYTGGTARNEIATATENSNFSYPVDSNGGAPQFWYRNSVYGFFSGTTTYTQAASHAGIPAPPGGGNIVKVTGSDNRRQAMWHRGPYNTFPPGTWSCFSVFVYVPSGQPDVGIIKFNNMYRLGGNAKTSTKDQWVRIYTTTLHGPDVSENGGISTDAAMSAGSYYVANTNWTYGQRLYPYFDGNTVDSATYHRTFDWGGGTTGRRDSGIGYVTLDNLPSATPVDPQASGSTYSKFINRWGYSDPYGEGQQRFRIEVRKKRRS